MRYLPGGTTPASSNEGATAHSHWPQTLPPSLSFTSPPLGTTASGTDGSAGQWNQPYALSLSYLILFLFLICSTLRQHKSCLISTTYNLLSLSLIYAALYIDGEGQDLAAPAQVVAAPTQVLTALAQVPPKRHRRGLLQGSEVAKRLAQLQRMVKQ
jgi:hypothetical protein